MNKLTQIGLSLVAALTLITQLPSSAFAEGAISAVDMNDQPIISPYVMTLETQYATKNNVKYKRRWNRYNGKWYDRAWVKINQPFPGP